MSLQLQPDLRPTPPWLGRLLAALALALAVLALGLVSGARRRPPEVLLSDGHPFAYLRAVERRIALARARVWVAMYVIHLDGDPDAAAPDDPAPALLRALAAAAKRGVDVRIVLDYGRNRSTGEIEPTHAVAQAWLAAHGVRVVLDELELTTHVKAVVVDERWVVLGSHNWTRSAITRNREVSLLFDDPALAAILTREVFARVPGWGSGDGAGP